MRLLPTPTSARRNLRGDDSFSRGMDAVITMMLFLGLGWLIDRWLGTAPWFMIGLFLLAAVGVFLGIKARYTAHMEQLEAQRREGATRHRADDLTRHRQDAPGESTIGADGTGP